MNGRITVCVGTKDRPTEVGLLMQSLRTQTFQDWDLLIVDDASGTPIQNFYFIMYLASRLKIEGHAVKLVRNNISNGIAPMRNQSAKLAIEMFPQNEFILRIDDDTLPQPDFLERLVDVINLGYDIASGVTPPVVGPDWLRETKFIEPLVNRVVLDDQGNFLVNSDDCGFAYLDEGIFYAHHFRSTALYRTTVHTEHNIWYEENLTTSGMREEEFFSFRCLLAGLKIGVDVQAIHYHMQTPSGGHRTCTPDKQLQNQRILNRWVKKKVKEHGNFIDRFNDEHSLYRNKWSNLNKSTNFIMTKEE